jgi:hypothetical protein
MSSDGLRKWAEENKSQIKEEKTEVLNIKKGRRLAKIGRLT